MTNDQIVTKMKSDIIFERIDKIDEIMAVYIENNLIESCEYEYDPETRSLKATVSFVDENVVFEIKGESK